MDIQRRDGVRRMLETMHGNPLSDAAWKWIDEESGWVDRYLKSDMRISEVYVQVERLATSFGSISATPGQRPRQKASVNSSADAWLETLRVLGAADARQQPRVRAFREQILKGQMLDKEDVPNWIADQAAADGEPSFVLGGVHVPASVQIVISQDSTGRRGLGTVPPLQIGVDVVAQEVTVPRVYYYGTDGTMQSVAIAVDGVLEDLHELSLDVADRYRWNEADATGFVLTDEPPPVDEIGVGVTIPAYLPAATIDMHIDFRATADRVAERYQEERQRLKLRRFRRPSDTTLALIRFYTENEDRLSRDEMLEAWNQDHPEARYSDSEKFAAADKLQRDARRARESLRHGLWKSATASDKERDDDE